MADLYMTIRRPIFGTGSVTAYTGTAGNAAAFGAGVSSVWVLCTTAAYVKVGVSATATSVDWPVAANVPIVIPIDGDSTGKNVSAVQVSSGGNLHIIGLAD
jgi:hypothetical protein